MPLFVPVDCPKDLECAICLEPWTDPAELAPCKHVFCRACVASINTCPECRKKITGRTAPNRILVNMAAEVKMECSDCGWQGTREQVKGHTKCEPKKRTGSSPQPQPQVNNFGGASNGFGTGVGSYNHQQHGGSAYTQPATAFGHTSNSGGPTQVISMSMGGSEPWKLYDLTQMEYDQIFCIFLQFDQDDSGELSKPELKKLARWLNFAHTDRDIDAMFRQMDSDGSGALSLEEFCTWLKYNRPDPQTLYGMSQTDYNYVLMQFHHYDTDATGELNQPQFVQLCTKCDLARTHDEAIRIFRQIDLDGGGTVDLHEFLTYRAQHHQSPQNSGAYNPSPSASGVYNPASAMNQAGYQQQQQFGGGVQPQASGLYLQQQQQQQQHFQPQPQPAAPAQQPQSAVPGRWAGPAGWERAVAPNGVPYYIDHNTKSTHWQPPAGYPA